MHTPSSSLLSVAFRNLVQLRCSRQPSSFLKCLLFEVTLQRGAVSGRMNISSLFQLPPCLSHLHYCSKRLTGLSSTPKELLFNYSSRQPSSSKCHLKHESSFDVDDGRWESNGREQRAFHLSTTYRDATKPGMSMRDSDII